MRNFKGTKCFQASRLLPGPVKAGPHYTENPTLSMATPISPQIPSPLEGVGTGIAFEGSTLADLNKF